MDFINMICFSSVKFILIWILLLVVSPRVIGSNDLILVYNDVIYSDYVLKLRTELMLL